MIFSSLLYQFKNFCQPDSKINMRLMMLTQNERKILKLMVVGMDNISISNHLEMDLNSVEICKKNISEKLQVYGDFDLKDLIENIDISLN